MLLLQLTILGDRLKIEVRKTTLWVKVEVSSDEYCPLQNLDRVTHGQVYQNVHTKWLGLRNLLQTDKGI